MMKKVSDIHHRTSSNSDTSDKTVALKQKWFDLILTTEELIKCLIEELKVDPNIEYSVLMRWGRKHGFWLVPGETLEKYESPLFTQLFLIPKTQNILIQYDFGPAKTVKADLPIPIIQQIEDIAKQLGLEGCPGYTLYKPAQKDSKAVPLESNFSLAEQTGFYDNLVFKRRFFTILENDFSNSQKIFQLYTESKEQILNGTLKPNEEKALKFAAMQFFIDSNMSTNVPDSVAYLFPKGSKLAKTSPKQISQQIQTFKYKTVEEAQKAYIKELAKLPNYGL